MKFLRHTLLPAILLTAFSGLAGCDAVGSPTATITGVDLAVQPDTDEFIEIQDVSGRAYARVESFPATVDVPLYSASRDYFMVLIGTNPDGSYRAVGASSGFRASDLTGASFTTTGDIEALLTLQ